MARHLGQSRGYDDLGPAVKRFDYMDRMDEDDERAVAEQRAEAARKSFAPVVPDKVLELGGSRFAVYSGAGALEMRRREAVVQRAREGGGR
ncbi:MAG: exonuclease V subunit alpha [Segniliparus sp.]|uniref:exonuclease V subunit alpha n=1 Tax=Segniliparus sp. TaxID=2804064 RepID=UPI003F34616D